jgi:hypothetical protein
VRRQPTDESATQRALWLAEIAQALTVAQALAWEVGAVRGSPKALEIYGEIEAALMEVQALRRSGSLRSPAAFDPEWLKPIPWEAKSY